MASSEPALSFDEILEQGSPTQETVWLCLNGELRARYDEIADRIESRRQERAAARLEAEERARRNAEPGEDDRLATRPEPVDPVPAEDTVVDPEQPAADDLIEQMKRWTVPFVLASVGERYNELVLENPPRRDPNDAKLIDPRDRSGFNTLKFYPALVRESLIKPEMTDERWEKLRTGPARLSDRQFEQLANAAVRVNRQDYDLPFSPADLETPPR